MVLPDGLAVLTLSQSASDADLSDYLDEIRVTMWEQVKASRDATIDGGAPSPIGTVDSDATSRSNIAGATLAAFIAKAGAQPFSIDWTDAANSVHTLDADGMIALGLAVMAHVNGAHENARALRGAIESAPTLTDLLSVDIRGGW